MHWGRAADDVPAQLAEEAAFLAELVVAQLPDEPEALGLLALIWFCQARRPARFDTQGRFVPLPGQDIRRWDHDLIARADRCLAQAAARQAPGPFQLEAAVQAAHVQGAIDGGVPWADIQHLYELLLAQAPTVGAQIAHAVATAQATNDAQLGLRLLKRIDTQLVAAHQPWWAAYAHLLAMTGDNQAAAAAFGSALALTAEPALRDWLHQQRQAHLPCQQGEPIGTGHPPSS